MGTRLGSCYSVSAVYFAWQSQSVCIILLCSWLWADEYGYACASMRYLIVDIELFISNGSRMCSTQYLVISVFSLTAAEPESQWMELAMSFRRSFFSALMFSAVRHSRHVQNVEAKLWSTTEAKMWLLARIPRMTTFELGFYWKVL